ncbi:hypothetical protein G6F58_012917 [Rhizopus delemar]|nr:hypothetical protein G6F58_012917 [Rhizopus delemar]
MQAVLQAAQQLQQHEADHTGGHCQCGQSTQHPQGQLQVAGDLHRQQQAGRQRRDIGQQRCRWQRGEGAVEHAHRRHPAQAQQRGQAEAEQQQQADAGTGQRRHRFRQRQALRH